MGSITVPGTTFSMYAMLPDVTVILVREGNFVRGTNIPGDFGPPDHYSQKSIGSNCPGISGTVPDLLTLSLVPEGFTTSLLLVPDVGQTAIITANSKFIFSQSRMCYANRSGFTINTLLKLQYSN